MPVYSSNTPVAIHPKVLIPKSLTEYMKKIGEELKKKHGDIEYSVLAKMRIEGSKIIVEPEIYIPYQKATWGFIVYDGMETEWAKRKQGFKVVIHKHPTGVRHFSSTDYSSINQDFPVSILFESNQWREATIMVEGTDGRRYVFYASKIEEYDDGGEIKVNGSIDKINDPEFLEALEKYGEF